MKRYLEHMHAKEPHARRTHAIQLAGVVVGVVFVGWLATLGVRLTTSDAPTQAASAINGLQVASTTYLSY